MKLHHLSFGAIGPFAGSHSVDFTAFSDAGLFLLEGPTGAGKSTLIDAVVFALYGAMADAEIDAHRMRSDYAAPDQESFVELVYEVGSGIYKVRRTPLYDKPKQRGVGTTRRQATARLWRLDNPADTTGEILTTRVEEASAEVARTVGLTRKQFVQTVVLPQGRFAAFLHAGNDERRALLQQIFGTELYSRLTEELRQRRLGAERNQATLQANLNASLQVLFAAADLSGEAREPLAEAADHLGLSGSDEGLEQLVDGLVNSAQADSAALADKSNQLTSQAAALQTESDQAAKLVETAKLRASLLARQAELQALAKQWPAAEARVSAARKALAVVPLLDQAEQAATKLEAAQESAAELGVPADPAEHGPLQAALDQAVAGVQKAEQQVQASERLEAATAASDKADLELETLRRAADEAGESDAAAQAALRKQSEEGPAAVNEVKRLTELLDQTKQLGKARQHLDQATKVHQLARQDWDKAAARETKLRRQRLDGMAGEMALELSPGQPCPVCGSTAHPHPAGLPEGHISKEELLAAEDQRAAAETTTEQAALALTEARESLAALVGATNGTTEADADKALKAARTHLVSLGNPTELKATAASAAKQLDHARVALAKAEITARRARDSMVELRSAAGGMDLAAATEALDQARAQLSLARRRRDAAQALTKAVETQAAAAAASTAALNKAGFEDAGAVREAALDAAEADLIEQQVQQQRSDLGAVAARLAEGDLAESKADLPALFTAAEAAAARALQAAESAAEASAAATRAVQTATKVESAAAAVKNSAAAYTKELGQAAPLSRVAALASGGTGNLTGVDLATYVLLRRFQDVVAAANDRLGPMSAGRYLLQHSETKERTRERRTGLALRVLDNRTGQARDPRSLSGGETFYVSLSLALGLADVVTAEAGGIDLETLFIDEGFGALDQDVLDAVMTQLGKLKA
ncbi:MAG: SMC family ATPase, partial [Bifidobacteriaceae bacterium]|nr:SMC family ATPase [Bifidobacteriaceae bacterium]